jgi:diacylglycerol kinase (ATP)
METSESSKSSNHPLVLLNPTANRGDMVAHRTVIRSRLAQEHAEYVETSRPGEARERSKRAAGDGRAIIVVGGDGTVNEVVNGILESGRRVPLGIVPAGSGNDFAYNTLRLPHNALEALERALHGNVIEVDAGMVNGQYFVNSFSVGVDADIAARANQLRKLPLMSGARLYYTSSLWQLLFGYHRCPWLTFHLDNNGHEQADEKQYVLLAITNGPAYGAGFRINPTADHTDGFFDVCAIAHAPLLRALKLLPVVQRGEHGAAPEVTFYRAKTLSIKSRQPVMMEVDGETSCASSFEAQILPGALLVRV